MLGPKQQRRKVELVRRRSEVLAVLEHVRAAIVDYDAPADRSGLAWDARRVTIDKGLLMVLDMVREEVPTFVALKVEGETPAPIPVYGAIISCPKCRNRHPSDWACPPGPGTGHGVRGG